jgi:hypothetical protein
MEVHTMKRDLDLARQLLLDIEARDADCSVSVLKPTPLRESLNGTANHNFASSNFDSDERIRYHLRLLIDGGYLREVDRTTAGVPCVRLTHDGHELIELTRREELWREAKWLCQEHTGGLSLTVIRTFLVRLATDTREYLPRIRRRVVRRPHYVAATDPRAPRNRVRYVRVRPLRESAERPLHYLTDVEAQRDYETLSRYDLEYETAYPSNLI